MRKIQKGCRFHFVWIVVFSTTTTELSPPNNVDVSRSSDNITYIKIDLRQFYEQVFGAAFAEYNAKQKRADREIPDYYEHVKKSGKGKLFYEVVVQVWRFA